MEHIIEDWREKIKTAKSLFWEYEKDLAIALLILLTGVTGYGLGKLAKIQALQAPINITGSEAEPANSLAPKAEAPAQNAQIVASKNGSKYYLP